MTLILSGTDGLSDVDGSAATPAIRGTDANTGIFFGADIIGFAEGGAEVARFNADAQFVAAAGTASLPVITTTGDVNTGIFFPAADTIAFSEGGVEAMRLDSSGNLGLGVTPSAWYSGAGTLQMKNGAVVAFSGIDGSLTTNAYYDTVWKYYGTGAAAQYNQNGGVHKWFNAASGTAGNTISFTQAMTLDANGRLFVNTTTEPGSNDSAVVIKAGGTSKSRCLSLEAVTTGSVIVQTFRNPNGQVGYIATDGSSTSYVTSSDYRLKESIQPMTGALAKVSLLKPVTYKWKVDGSDGQGFIAHELQEVVPDAVSGAKDATEIQKYEISPAVPATFDEEGNELTSAVEAVMGEREVPSYQGIDTSFLVATLTAAIQELKAIVDAQAVEIAALKGTP